MTQSLGGHEEVPIGSLTPSAKPAGRSDPDTSGRDSLPEPGHLSLDQVAELTAMTPRNVRAYQQRGLIPPPTRSGRHAYYDWEHVTRLRLVGALHEHGLTLKVIADLVERGTADAELARLGREELSDTWTKAVRVPAGDSLVKWMKDNRPEVLEQLIESGLMDLRDDGRHYVNAAALGLSSSLGKLGLMPDVGTRVALLAAESAAPVVEGLMRECERVMPTLASAEQRREASLQLMQLAAIAVADTLHNRLAHTFETDPLFATEEVAADDVATEDVATASAHDAGDDLHLDG